MTGSQALERGSAADRYTVYAVRYAQRVGHRGEHFLGWDTASAEEHSTAYYAWLALSQDRTVLVDCGMRTGPPPPLSGWRFKDQVADVLAAGGVDPDDVDTLILTHLHYDHAGGMRAFRHAAVVVQEREVAYWHTAAAKRNEREAWLVSADDLAHLDAVGARGDLRLVSGDVEVAPRISVHLVGGHTAGLQVVRIQTPAGPVVVASDASHFYENLDTARAGTIVHEMPAVYAAFDRLRELATDGVMLPGHDPAIIERYGVRSASPGQRLVRINPIGSC